MSKINFTRRSVENLPIPKAKRVTHYDEQVRGLGVLIQPTGHRSFFWFRKIAGRPTWRTIGQFPDFTPEQARSKAEEWNGEMGKWKGNDYEGPSPFERPLTDLTLSLLLDQYVEKHLKQHAKRPEDAEKDARWLLKKYGTSLSPRKLGQIRRPDILRLQQKIADNAGGRKPDARTSSNRVLQLLKAMFNFAISSQLWTGENPCRGVKLYHEEKRLRFVKPDEMPLLFAALKSEPNPDVVDFVNLSLWTGARKSDIFSMRWQDVSLNDNKWDVPDPKSDPYTIALTPEAIAILKRRLSARKNDSSWVFPGVGKTGHLVDLKGRWKELLKRADIENLRQHDLRRTLGSYQTAAGTSLSIVGKSLGHKSLAATQVYAQLDLDPVRASVMKATRTILSAGKKKAKLLPASGAGA